MTCAENWACTAYMTTNGSNLATRTCTDKNSCGTSLLKPSESVTLPTLDQNFYRCNVQPILDNKCSMLGCHGSDARALRTYSRGRFRNTETVTETGCLMAGTKVPLDPNCIGSIECICWTGRLTSTEWQRNYDSARAFALDANGVQIAAGMEDKSELIAQPIVGGRAHTNVHLFRSGDPEHTTLKQWLSGATLATCSPPYN